MTSVHRVLIAGFGNVGQALARLIASENPAVSGVAIAGVSDPRFGTVVSDGSLDAAELLSAAASRGFASLAGHMPGAGVLEMIDSVHADTLVELTFTDLQTGEPAATHLRRAFSAGMSVSTTNKGPIALHYRELRDLAQANGVVLTFEGTVMSGTPVFQVARVVRSAGCEAMLGVLNGTTNYIITRMENGVSYELALAEAQGLGYAEADPGGDVEGYDSAAKLAILAEVLGDVQIPIDDIEREPVSSISLTEAVEARDAGDSWRYVATLENRDGMWSASVSPRRLDARHPLAGVAGAGNGITFRTDILGDVTLYGPGAGPEETAFAVVSDLEQISRESAGRHLWGSGQERRPAPQREQ